MTDSAPPTEGVNTPPILCEHGLGAGDPEWLDVRECQQCDWCPDCVAVRRYDGEICTFCGYIWGGA